MNVGFAGTPAFAATVLAALLDAGLDVPLVLTQPDRPRGRGLRHEPSPVKRLGLERGLRVEQPAKLAGQEARAMLDAAGLDVLVSTLRNENQHLPANLRADGPSRAHGDAAGEVSRLLDLVSTR